MSDKYEGLGLSEEEISAMEEELGEDTGVEAEADDAEEVEDEQEAAAGDDADEVVEPEVEAKADEPEPKVEVEAAPVAEAAPSALDKLESELAEVKKQFDDGDISIDEYIDAKSALDRKIVKAELKAELAQEAASKSWEQSQSDFLGQHDYLRDEVVYGAFAMQVNKLLADPKSASLTDEALLAAAKAKVDAAFGRKPGEPEPPKGESPIRKAKKDAADTSKIPITLQGIPAAAPPDDVDGNRFAYLDRLSGEAFEAAISKLSDDDRNRWARSQ
jgi:hypothetical protein